jgi:hypothetical protein
MRRLRALCLLLALCALAAGARAEDKWVVLGGFGAFDLPLPTDHEDIAPAYELELRIKPGLWHFHPHLGFQGTTDGMVYGYAGIHLDYPIGHLRLVPSGSIGLYNNNENKKDLDGLMEFRIGGGVAWQFDSGPRVGVTWYHMSNAGTVDQNPGAEMMFLELGWAF